MTLNKAPFILNLALGLALVVTECNGASLGINWDIFMNDGDFHTTGQSVHYFARHSLCQDTIGKIRLFNAFSAHLCDLSENLKVALVLDLCSRQDHMLDQWVGEIYDIDRDGFISHTERTFYADREV